MTVHYDILCILIQSASSARSENIMGCEIVFIAYIKNNLFKENISKLK